MRPVHAESRGARRFLSTWGLFVALIFVRDPSAQLRRSRTRRSGRIDGSVQLTLNAVGRHTGSAGSRRVSAVAGRWAPIRWATEAVPGRNMTASETRRQTSVVIQQTIRFALGASLVCLCVVLIRYSPDDASVSMWLVLDQPAFWALSIAAAFMNTRAEPPLPRLSGLARSAVLLLGVVSLGWFATLVVLWLLMSIWPPVSAA